MHGLEDMSAPGADFDLFLNFDGELDKLNDGTLDATIGMIGDNTIPDSLIDPSLLALEAASGALGEGEFQKTLPEPQQGLTLSEEWENFDGFEPSPTMSPSAFDVVQPVQPVQPAPVLEPIADAAALIPYQGALQKPMHQWTQEDWATANNMYNAAQKYQQQKPSVAAPQVHSRVEYRQTRPAYQQTAFQPIHHEQTLQQHQVAPVATMGLGDLYRPQSDYRLQHQGYSQSAGHPSQQTGYKQYTAAPRYGQQLQSAKSGLKRSLHQEYESPDEEPPHQRKRFRRNERQESQRSSTDASGISDYSRNTNKYGYALRFNLQTWGSRKQFKYSREGELRINPKTRLSKNEIEEFLYTDPAHRNGHAVTLWIGRMPYSCNERFTPGPGKEMASMKCRYDGCIAKNATIEKGVYSVVFDEFQGCKDVPNPFLLPRMHLWCLERHFDFPKLVQTLNVRMETREVFARGALPDPDAQGMVCGRGDACGRRQIDYGRVFLKQTKLIGTVPAIPDEIRKMENPDKLRELVEVYGEYPTREMRGNDQEYDLLNRHGEFPDHGPYLGTLGWRLAMLKKSKDVALRRHQISRPKASKAKSTFLEHLFDLPIQDNCRRITRRPSHQACHLKQSGSAGRIPMDKLATEGPRHVKASHIPYKPSTEPASTDSALHLIEELDENVDADEAVSQLQYVQGDSPQAHYVQYHQEDDLAYPDL